VTRFLLGFAAAAAAAAGVYWFVLRDAGGAPCSGRCGDGTTCAAERCVVATVVAAAPAEESTARGKGRRRRPGRRGAGTGGDDEAATPEERTPDWNGSDDLDLPPQEIDVEHGGERQLSNTVIESTMGKSFGSIRRCIMLAQSDRETPVRGRMKIGMRIRSTGEVGAVKVSPPGPLASSELGPCVRNVVGRIRFPRFDGRDMVVTYPVTLE
jgi:hypothetical protein